MDRNSYYIVIFFLFISCFAKETLAASIETSSSNTHALPVFIEADNFDYNKEEKTVSASGNVEIIQGKRILIADKVEYYQTTNEVIAYGNIRLREPDGTMISGDYVRLLDNLKEGVINKLGARFKDGSILAAKEAKKFSNGNMKMNKAVYTSCKVCKDKEPIWQIKSSDVKLDEAEEKVSYKNAFFEVYGVPILYTPYFSHPSPGAKRESGFLNFSYYSNSVLGATIETPYYFNIAPNADATLTPIITSKEGTILDGSYRHLLANGEMDFRASIMNADERDANGFKTSGKDLRGHIEGRGNFSINDEWNWGFKGKRASDDTYLGRYNFGNEDLLTSRLFAEQIDNRNSSLVETISFQGLKVNDDPGQSPLISPYARHHIETKPFSNSSRFFADASVLSLNRDDGVSSQRSSVEGGWMLPYISNSGQVFELSTSLRTDGYYVDQVDDPTRSGNETLNGLTGRVVPETQLKWSYPVMNVVKDNTVIIEPMIQAIASPYGGNPDKIPNEDSQDIEFSDENLFSDNHFTGLDRVESGPRINYGIRSALENPTYGNLDFIFGQNYKTKKDENFSSDSGLDDYLSDYVGRIGYNYDNFDISYRFRIDEQTNTLKRNSVRGYVYGEKIDYYFDYLILDEGFDDVNLVESESREIFRGGSTVRINEKFEINGYVHRDIENGEWISANTNLVFHIDCVDLIIGWQQDFVTDRDIVPSESIGFKISLKNLSN